jgi:hypothetical protein
MRLDTWFNNGRYVDKRTGLINKAGLPAGGVEDPKFQKEQKKMAKTKLRIPTGQVGAVQTSMGGGVSKEEAFQYFKQGKKELAELYRGGTAVAACCDDWYPKITGPLHLTCADLSFDEFLNLIASNAQGASNPDGIGGVAVGGADLTVTLTRNMIGAKITVGYQDDIAMRGMIGLTQVWTIGGATATQSILLYPRGGTNGAYVVAQFMLLAVSANAGKAQPALATVCAVTLPQQWGGVAQPGFVAGATVSIEPLTLRDLY